MNIIWLHGFGENAEMWKEFTPLIYSYYNSFCFDHSETIGHTSIKDYCQDLHNFILENDIEKPVLVGHSMGGYVALEYASQFPNNISGLGLFHSTALADPEARKKERDKTKIFIKKHGSGTFLRTFYPNMFSEEFQNKNSELIAAKLEKLTQINPEALISATEAMKNRLDHTTTLAELTVPVFQILGKQDPFVTVESALKQTLLLQKPSVLLLENIAHAGMYENPEMCSTFINNFLASTYTL